MKTQKTNRARHHELARTWRYQLFDAQTVWLHRSWLVLGIVTGLLLLSLVTNIVLFPLKQKVPYVLSVNTTTGELSQVGELSLTKLNSDWSLTRFLLMRYVQARESFDIDNLEQPYQIAWAMSDKSIAGSYEKETNSQNPTSAYHRFGKNQFVTVRILSVSKLNNNTATVRFEQTLHDRNNDQAKQIQKEAILRWRFDTSNLSQKMLDRDPLGFKVTYYQTSSVNLDN